MAQKNVAPDIASQRKARFSPSSFLRTRRPEQFSDTHRSEVTILDKSFFEYHLNTITNRSDEKSFEHFCRKLAQKEICPNLIPQTGPTGGGDSKVDTETYPVANEIAERWYEGSANAGSERWAFAISAMKKWKPKIRSDVAKICATNRGYTLIYFFSNQFIKDKDRSTIEDELSKKHIVPVRILDRHWIVEKVFERHHIDLAIEALNISAQARQKQSRTGPLDTTRRLQLDELEAQINDQTHYVGVEYQLAEDCLSAAIIARELELGRVDVDGRFDRAERIADRVGQSQQRLRIKYQRAWTACYWFDDFDTVNRLYDDIESFATASKQAADLERLSNIWTVIVSGVRHGYLTEQAAHLNERTTKLKASLTEIASNTQRANNAAHAETLLCSVELTECFDDEGTVKRVLQQFATIFLKVEHLGGYPFDQYASLFEELGDLLGNNSAYDDAFELILPILERRRSEGAAGLALLKRGAQKLEVGKYCDAIKLLGRAQQKLIKHEYRDDLVFCLIACAHAYEQLGLLWAAHSNLLAATSLALSEFVSDGRLVGTALLGVQRLIWAELQLGRVPQVLTYLQFQEMLASHLQMDDEWKARYQEQCQNQDGVFGMLLLRSSLRQLTAMERLPKTIERLGLYGANMALLFALGHEKLLIDEGYFPEGTSQTEVINFFELLANQPAKDDLPPLPEIFDEDFYHLKSSVLGCQWNIKIQTTETASRIGEAFLGFIESFFATSLSTDAIPHRQHICIFICAKESKPISNEEAELQIVLNDPEFLAKIEYTSSYDPNMETVNGKLRNFLQNTLAVLIPRILYVPSYTKYFDRIAVNEEGFGRSLTFSDTFTSASNVVGTKPIYQLSEWLDDDYIFPVKRAEAVQFNAAIKHEKITELKYGAGNPPDELLNAENLKHGQRRVLSLIDMELWEMAKWDGLAVAHHPGMPPFLALLFRNEEPARHIFTNWQKRFGNKDENEIIRIGLITGVDRRNPTSYGTTISTNIENAVKDRKQFDQEVVVFRIQRIDKPDPKNLDTLISAHRAFGAYVLMPAIFNTDLKQPHFLPELGILKRELIVRPAWQINDNDPDLAVLLPDDNPIIPEGVIDPPVTHALNRRQKLRA